MALPFSTAILAAINDAAGQSLGRRFRLSVIRPVEGGSINRTLMIADARDRFFLKLNRADALPMFRAEAAGLAALREAGMRVPAVLAQGTAGAESYLLLEHLPLREARDGDFIALAGVLGRLHEQTSSRYGWEQANFIGSTPQHNPWTGSWTDFWRGARLESQLRNVRDHGHGGLLGWLGERLIAALPAVFRGHSPAPVLVHGDLWRGNVGFLANGTPALFDPAVYYGDREVDIAMTELFGGFPQVFYDAYFERCPVDEGYAARRDVYNLYHLLNHLCLSGSYLGQIESLMRRVLATVE